MKAREAERLLSAVALVVLMACGPAAAQRQEVTVPYLRAAIGSLDNRARIVLRAEYNAAEGLREATEIFLRGKGYSRFKVSDPDTGVVFDEMYCHLDSRAFDKLLKTTKNAVFVFTGYRARGERKDPAVMVTDVREVRSRGVALEDESAGQPSPPQKFQITITDRASSNTTVITNVELGQPYNVFGSRLIIEQQPEDPGFTVIEP